MSKTFVISDTHFGHKRILEYEPIARPFTDMLDHDNTIIHLWNSVVKPEDVVWHLGDVWFGKDGHWPLEQMIGRKRLVLGNHDRFEMELYSKYFEKIVGCYEFGNCILSHMPVHESQFGRYKLNVHGHCHSKTLEDRRYVNVSAEALKLRPVYLDTLIFERMNEIYKGDL
jgi:calcineurin-like phosphoesterase family protein